MVIYDRIISYIIKKFPGENNFESQKTNDFIPVGLDHTSSRGK